MAERTRRGIIAIGVMKLFKGLALIVAGIGLLSLLHRDAADTVRHWIEYIRIDPHDHWIDHLLEKIAGVDHRTMRRLGIGTLFYAAVFCTEGMGLLLKQHWAEYMTTGVTTSFLPLEIYELVRHPSIAKTFVVLLNIAVVIYLVHEIRSERRHKQHGPRDPAPTPNPKSKALAEP
jgi:uncharacterized membrane protein (DUF2068 family)